MPEPDELYDRRMAAHTRTGEITAEPKIAG
jgi:hypothetical protein